MMGGDVSHDLQGTLRTGGADRPADQSAAAGTSGDLRFGYACGAPRVTLNVESASVGPRAHVSGFLAGLRAANVEPRIYLAGDGVPQAASAAGSEDRMSGSLLRRVAVDGARLGLRYAFQQQALRRLGDLDIIYERQATMQDVGRPFQRRGSWWVIESNGPFWYEAGAERNSLALVGAAKRLELNAYRDADLVVVVSDALKEIVVRESRREPDDVYVLANATDATRFDPDGATPRRIGTGFTVGWVGYMTEWAGLDLLLQAVARESASVVLVGDGPARVSLEELTAWLGVAHRVHFVGNVAWTDVPDLMGGFDVAYSGQRQMSIGSMYHSPQKLYEYQAMALPIIASDFPDARRLITETDSGWLFDSGDVDGIADALRRASAADDLTERGARARTNILARHTWAARVRELLMALDERGMLERRRGARAHGR